MATSGLIGNGGYQGRHLEFAWVLVSQDIATNSSVISWRVTVVGGSSSYYYHYRDYCDAFGAVLVNNNSRTKRYQGDLANGRQTVYHDANGNFNFSAHVVASIYSSTVNEDITGSWSLPTIPRQATLTSMIGNFTDEDDPWLTYSNPAGLGVKAWLEVNPNGDHICERTCTGGRLDWNLTDAERKLIRQKCTKNTQTIRVGIYTNINGQWVNPDYRDRTITIKDPMPIAGTPTWKSTNFSDLTLATSIIKGYSKVAVTVPLATPVKEAVIKQYKVIIGDKMVSSANPGIFNFDNVNDSIIKVYVEDSRGNTVEKILNIASVFEYFPPVFKNLSIERTKGGIGTNVVLKFSGSWWRATFDKVSNALTMQYYYKEQGSSGNWIQGTTNIYEGVFSGNDFDWSFEIAGDLGALGFDASKNYDIKITAGDKITNTSKQTILTTGKPNIAIHQNGVAFGAFYDPDVGGAMQVEGKRFPPLPTKQLYMVSGTKVLTVPSSNAVKVHKWEDIVQLFKQEYDITITDRTKLGISFINGDSSQAAHVEGGTWVGDSSKGQGDIHAVLDRNASGSIRINYSYFYVV